MGLLNYTDWQNTQLESAASVRKKSKKKYIPVNKRADSWLQEVDALEGSVAKLKAILDKKKINPKITVQKPEIKTTDEKLKPDTKKEKEIKKDKIDQTEKEIEEKEKEEK